MLAFNIDLAKLNPVLINQRSLFIKQYLRNSRVQEQAKFRESHLPGVLNLQPESEPKRKHKTYIRSRIAKEGRIYEKET